MIDRIAVDAARKRLGGTPVPPMGLQRAPFTSLEQLDSHMAVKAAHKAIDTVGRSKTLLPQSQYVGVCQFAQWVVVYSPRGQNVWRPYGRQTYTQRWAAGEQAESLSYTHVQYEFKVVEG